MINKNIFFECFFSSQIMIISTMLPINILVPSFKSFNTIYLPISWQVPIIILLTIIFSSQVTYTAYILYLILGLFVLPVFNDGGSLGYILTPNFGYLLGIFPLINIINKLKFNNKITSYKILINGIKGIFAMHFFGIIYLIFIFIIFSQTDLIFYTISKYSLLKIPYQILMLVPIIIIYNIFKKLRVLN